MTEELQQVLAYHQATKHHPHQYARGPSHLDWATQPDPFRRYQGAPTILLERIGPDEGPPYEQAFWSGQVAPQALNGRMVSQLFFDSLALSAWKQAGRAKWSLRINPSSGNLHPTEGYLVCGSVEGLTADPIIAHYRPHDHALEVRAWLPRATWQALSASLAPQAILVGLSSVHWREAWKYGERAFRYCQHDVGHALAALSLAAAGLGWQATLLDGVGTGQIAGLLGLSEPHGAEVEQPDCLVAIYPPAGRPPSCSLPADALAGFRPVWQGEPNRLSASHLDWPIIEQVAAATQKPPTDGTYDLAAYQPAPVSRQTTDRLSALSLRKILHQRRSAVSMDAQGETDRASFFGILEKTIAQPGRLPFSLLSWSPKVHLVIFVHRVKGLPPGLYLLVRDQQQKGRLQAAFRGDWVWERPDGCPDGLEVWRLAEGDAQTVARQLSCHQEIASDGCFSLGMVTDFEDSLKRFGPWFYRRLFWECGMIGQVLYLEAEAAGMRGTGIGCFFDDAVHHLLGLETAAYQSLYHFTVGYPVEDTRLITLPAYP